MLVIVSVTQFRWVSHLKTDALEKQIIAALKNERERQGLSKNKLAELAGIDQRAVTFIERGDNSPKLTTLLSICQALSISLDEVCKRADRASP